MQGGENLKSIAKSVWGDSNLWYLIANANNLEVDSPLTAGQTLKLPARVNVVHNDADTFTPYNPSEAIGNTTPTLPMPANSAGGCGGAGAILVVVVAIVVTVLTEGATSDFLVESLAWAQGAADVAGAVVGAAAGSIASQGVAIAIGQQESFSWSAVAMSALSAGVTRGFAGPVDGGWVDKAKNAALANATTQGVAVLTGMQDRFDWRSVVSAAVSAGVGEAVGSSETLAKLGAGVHRGLTVAASRTAATLAVGGKVDVKDIAVDAFGNALGASLLANIKESAANRQFINALNETGVPYTLDDDGRPLADPNFRASFAFVQGSAQAGASVDQILQAQAALANGLNQLDGAAGDLSEDVLRNRTANALAAEATSVGGRSVNSLTSDSAEVRASSRYVDYVSGTVQGPKGADIIGNTVAGGIELMTEFAGFYEANEFAASAIYKGVQAVLSGGPVKTVVLEIAKVGVESILEDATGAIANVAETQARDYVTDYARKNELEFGVAAFGQNITVLPEQFGQAAGVLAGGVVESILGKGVDAFATRGAAISNVTQVGRYTPSRPGGYRTDDVDEYGRLSPQVNRAPGYRNSIEDNQVQAHHPIQNEWARMNVPGYNTKHAPAILLESSSGSPHSKISAAQRSLRNDLEIQGIGSWNTSIHQEFNYGYRQMIDSGVQEDLARKAIKDSYKYFDSLGAFKK